MKVIPQLSNEPPSISEIEIESNPNESKKMVVFRQITVGGIVSRTVTFALQESTFPLGS